MGGGRSILEWFIGITSALVASRVEGSGCKRGMVFDGVKVNRGGPAEDSLPSPSVVGPFDPSHDR